MSNNKYKILVVEDEANIRTFMETILESNNYQMICAGSCAPAALSRMVRLERSNS